MGRPKTSDTHPLRVDFVAEEMLSLPGRLGLTFAPGKRATGIEGLWERDLDADLGRLKGRYGTDLLVSLMQPEEYRRFGVPGLLEAARGHGMKVLHLPISDGGVPEQLDEVYKVIRSAVGALRRGETVVAHCRGGLDRTGMFAACVLVQAGRDPDEAIRAVREARGEGAVETPEQEDFVRGLARDKPLRRRPTQLERYRGSLLGLAVGDALGAAVEFKPPGSFPPVEDMVGGGTHGLEAGQWTDDTSMALCLAQSLVERKGMDLSDQLRRYLRWYREGYLSSTGECFDIGNATREALERFETTGDPRSGSTDPDRSGNGSIMRLAPVPLFYARGPFYPFDDRPVEAIERSGESSLTTHGSPAAVDACRYLGSLIVGAVNGVEKDRLGGGYSPDNGSHWERYPFESEEIQRVAEGDYARKEPLQIKGSGYVVESLEAALWAFHGSYTFEEGMLLAVNLGDDADTTGAVYGQLAGAYYGEREIPERWRRRLSDRLLIEHLAERLYEVGERLEWRRLLDFLPGLERCGFVTEDRTGHGGESERYRRDRGLEGQARSLLQTLYEVGVLHVFDWGEWQETAESLFREPESLARADEATIRNVLTFHARKDRFQEGHLEEMLASGHLAVLLRRVAEIGVDLKERH